MSWSVSVGGQGAGRRFAGTGSWLLMLPVIAFVCAASTFHFSDNISTSPLRWLPFVLGASAPVLWIAARIVQGPLSATLLKGHAALYAAFVIIKLTMAEHHHGNGFAIGARLLDWIENIVVLTGDAIAIALA